MPAQDVTFKDLWQQLPTVTRTLTLAAGLIAMVCTLNPYWSHWFWYSHSILRRGRFWTILTAPLTFQGTGISYLMSLVGFYMNLNAAETTKFRRVADLAFYMMFIAAAFLVTGPYFNSFAYLSGITAALTYTIAQEDPDGMIQYFVFQTRRKYTPWLSVVIGLASGGVRGTIDPILGILFAHAFLFFDEILPMAGGPRLTTPRWIVKTEQTIREKAEIRRAGGHRLGK